MLGFRAVRERAISAAVIAAVVIVAFLLGQPWLTLGIAALSLLAAWEVFRLLPAAGFPVEPLPGVILPPLLVLRLHRCACPSSCAACWRAAAAAAGLLLSAGVCGAAP